MKTQSRFLAFLLILVLSLSTPALAEEDKSIKIIDAWPMEGYMCFLTDDGKLIWSNGHTRPSFWGSSDVVSVVKDGGTIPMLIHSDGSIVPLYTEFEFDNEEWHDLVLMGASETHAVGLKQDGTWISAGEYRNGECDVEEWTDIVQLQVGKNFTVGLKSDGTVVATGENRDGRCNVSKWTDIVKIAVSPAIDEGYSKKGYYSITLGLKSDGTVVATGGEKNSDQTFVGRWKNVIDICAGEYASYGITKEGKILTTSEYFSKYVPKDQKCENAIGIMVYYGEIGSIPILVTKVDNTFEAFGKNADIFNKYLSDPDSLLEDMNKDPSESQKADSSKSLTSSECQQIALDYLKKMLKNPDSLQVHSNSATKSGDSYIVEIDYSAMNGFGGYNRETFICTVDKDGNVSGAFSY